MTTLAEWRKRNAVQPSQVDRLRAWLRNNANAEDGVLYTIRKADAAALLKEFDRTQKPETVP